MRAIFLNCWYSKAGESFWQFLEENSSTVDIFCFQEVSPEMFSKMSVIFEEYNGFFESAGWFEYFKLESGQAIFVKKNFKVLSSGKTLVFRKTENDRGFLMYADLEKEGKVFSIGNIHGKWSPGNKLDSPIRIKQSQKVIGLFKKKNLVNIVGGDFNLMPETESVGMFTKEGYRNLIKEFKIGSTRNELTWASKKNDPGFVKQYFSDYIFTSPGVKVTDFSVPKIQVSDHLPLILDFEV
ncbi:hypothetical protein HY502_01820 [Candidatus Woesebacteria bacterium]|nr:hypothetical protein [Candidatus Woesebacteria bacterium]